MSTVTNSWMPAPGRYPVSVGSSLGRALKVRKGVQVPPKKFERDFYNFKYNFMPESVDPTKSGTVDVRRGKDTTAVNVMRGSSQVSLVHMIGGTVASTDERCAGQSEEGGLLFVGQEHASKEVDCVLIYDEETGEYTLEKIEATINLTFDRKTSQAPRHPSLPPVAPSIATSTSTSSSHSHTPAPSRPPAQSQADIDFDNELLKELVSDTKQKGKSLPSRPSASMNSSSASISLKAAAERVRARQAELLKEEEEEGEVSEGEIVEKPWTPESAARAKLAVRPAAVHATATPTSRPNPPSEVSARSRPSQARLPSSTATKPPLSGGKNKRSLPVDVEEETLEFGRAAQPLKRARPSPPPSSKPKEKEKGIEREKTFELALPSSSHAPSLPSAVSVELSLPGSSSDAVLLPPAPVAPLDSEDEDWDEVQPSPTPAPAPAPLFPPRKIEMEEIVPTSSRRPESEQEEDDEDDMEETEIDMRAFEAEMNRHLDAGEDVEVEAEAEEEEDWLAADMSQGGERGAAEQGAVMPEWGDEDDYSSSEESDDD
ncbi:uncharacterized protein LAESUDRAFT_709893 [Laetiporus sulphureus 93-53]|uniref:Transcription elongation factor Eaf N-terminal domain-containing protein n=1 Tax=Laetiporus sulphureus 93-53 TaxID=1314785 RepID=A0A165I7F4_9APHY|nr:uncharacterized protein LAESUDRAFT_709893 [Laetiporus sulphureus 93-53]KZT12689.1 hypothetical protein LAESUDRAFT_709893 [Laetiporus sulphureus 93-53]